MDLNDLQGNPDSIEAGVWVSDIPKMGDLAVKVRGMVSMEVINYRARKTRVVPRSKRDADGNPNSDAAMEVFSDTLLNVILLDWKGLTNNGEEVPYSREMAKELCLNPKYRAFQDAVTWASTAVSEGYRKDEDEAKNSETRSDTSLISRKKK